MQRRTQTTTRGRRGMKPAAGRSATRPKAARGAAKTSARRAPRPTETTPSGVRKIRGRLGAKTTTDHEKIRRWAEERGGWPATVIRTASPDDPGILRIDFPGYKGKGSLKPIAWDDWFDKFDERHLAFLYQERTASGNLSRFFKVVRQPK